MISTETPKVTICVPVRNGGRTIRTTLNSLLDQDYKNFDIIVSDNCSDDDTAAIVKSYASKGVRYFHNPVMGRGGAEGNWNHILTLAEGPLIALFHADDIYAPNMVSEQVGFMLDNPGVSAVFTSSQAIDDLDRPTRRGLIGLPPELKGKHRFSYSELLNFTLKYTTFVSVPTMMTTRTVIDTVGDFDWENFASAADIDLYLRMAQLGPIGVIDKPLHQYRFSDFQESAHLFHQRTFLAHFFNVLDYHIRKKENQNIIQKEPLAVYRAKRAADQIRCGIYLLAQNKEAEAKLNFDQALTWSSFFVSIKMLRLDRPQELVFYGTGCLLRAAISIGVSRAAGRTVHQLLQNYLNTKRKPKKEDYTCQG